MAQMMEKNTSKEFMTKLKKADMYFIKYSSCMAFTNRTNKMLDFLMKNNKKNKNFKHKKNKN
jgi:hypothetical protein